MIEGDRAITGLATRSTKTMVGCRLLPWRGGACPSCGGSLSARQFDLILLDIDNGPTFLAVPENERLHTNEGLALLRTRLAPGGVAVFWARERCAEFERRLDALPPGAHRTSPAEAGLGVLFRLIRRGYFPPSFSRS